MKGLSGSLRSLTQGRVTFQSSFDSYMPMAAQQQADIVKSYKREEVEE